MKVASSRGHTWLPDGKSTPFPHRFEAPLPLQAGRGHVGRRGAPHRRVVQHGVEHGPGVAEEDDGHEGGGVDGVELVGLQVDRLGQPTQEWKLDSE